jgi:tRNA(Ile)-lysidine synthase
MAYSEVLCDNMLLRAKFQEYDEVIVKRVILKYFSSFDIKLDRTHLIEVLKLVNKIGKVQIKGNFFAISNKDYLRFADFSVSENNFPFVSKILKISELNNKCVDFYCDCDKIIGAVHIRTRLAGDSITPANRGCSKTLKKLFNELKIPPELRNSVAVVADDVGVIGVVGYCVDERVKVDCNTKNTFCLLRLPSED